MARLAVFQIVKLLQFYDGILTHNIVMTIVSS